MGSLVRGHCPRFADAAREKSGVRKGSKVPDFEAERESHEILSRHMGPGDAVAFHVLFMAHALTGEAVSAGAAMHCALPGEKRRITWGQVLCSDFVIRCCDTVRCSIATSIRLYLRFD